MTPKVYRILEEIKHLSLADLVELKKKLATEWGQDFISSGVGVRPKVNPPNLKTGAKREME